MLICRKCGNCDDSKLKLERHIFKNQTYHIKQLCYECGKTEWIPRTEEAMKATMNKDWEIDHKKSIRKDRESDFIAIRKQLRRNQTSLI